MTIQTAVLIENTRRPRRRVRWVSCNIFSTQTTPPPRSSSDARYDRESPGGPVFAWKGESLEEYWWCTEQMLRWPATPGDDDLG